MKARPSWSVCVFFSLLAWAGSTMSVAAAKEDSGAATTALYTASDFPKLAQGVDPGFVGEATIHIWAPSGDVWRLSPEKGTVTLHFQSAGEAIPCPAGRR